MEKETRIFKINDFQSLKNWVWGGACQVIDQVEEKKLEECVVDVINTLLDSYEEGIEETKLNDYIWFDLVDDLDWNYNIKLYDEEDE